MLNFLKAYAKNFVSSGLVVGFFVLVIAAIIGIIWAYWEMVQHIVVAVSEHQTWDMIGWLAVGLVFTLAWLAGVATINEV